MTKRDMDYIIETFNLTKVFSPARGLTQAICRPFRKTPKITPAISNITLQIKQGEIFSLIGPNGAGKSTLVKILCCLLYPTNGKAQVAGYDILRDEDKVKSQISLVTEGERSFYWRLTGRQNLEFFASLYNIPSFNARLRIRELFELLEISEPDKRFQEYSTGIRQRLAIARSLLNNPRVLFMDEPTKSLDPGNAQRLRIFIKNKLVKEQKMSIFVTTHNLEEAQYLSSRVALIDKGEIKNCGTMEDIKKDIAECFFAN